MKLSKEILKSLVELLTRLTGKGQEEISVCCGYKKETITKAISTGSISPKMIEKIELTFKEELKKSTYFEDKLSKGENKELEPTGKIKMVHSKIEAISIEVQNEAFRNVATRKIAKLIAKVYNLNFDDVLDEWHQDELLEISMLVQKRSLH